MKKFLPQLILFLLLLSLAPQAQEGEDDPECIDDKEITIFYVNGILNTEDDATRAMNGLRNLYKAHYKRRYGEDEVDKLQFRLAYNHTSGVVDDIERVFAFHDSQQSQTIQHIDPGAWRIIREIVNYGQSEGITRLREQQFNALNQALSDLSTHLNFYQKEYTEGRKVLIVAHSEGNFFANFAHEALDGLIQDSTKIVAVATPAAVVHGNLGAYTTFRQDQVINYFRELLVVDRPLPANLDICGERTDFLGGTTFATLGHGFVEDYMFCDSSRNQIFRDMDNSLAVANQPPELARDSIITVTLTWGDQPDVDLHVYEPSGWHVFYANPVGPLGGLDVDDTDKRGPEHYYASCQTLQPGTFRVGVNYFHGFEPEQATLIVQAGQLIRRFVVDLPSARGSGGDTTPIIACNIIVEGSQEDGFKFSIEAVEETLERRLPAPVEVRTQPKSTR